MNDNKLNQFGSNMVESVKSFFYVWLIFCGILMAVVWSNCGSSTEQTVQLEQNQELRDITTRRFNEYKTQESASVVGFPPHQPQKIVEWSSL